MVPHDQLIHDALKLPEAERIELAQRLLASISEPVSQNIIAECDSRVGELLKGDVKTVSSREVFAELEERQRARK